MTTPYQSPDSAARAKTSLPLWENLLFGLVVLCSVAYAVACLVHIYSLNQIVGLAHDEIAGNRPSVATLNSRANFEDHITTTVTVTFWAMYLLFIGWVLGLNSRFRKAGTAAAFRKTPAWMVWRVGLLASLLIVVVLRTNTSPTSLSDVVSQGHKEMLYLVVRVVIACLYVWCAFSMRHSALTLRAAERPANVASQPLVPPTASDSVPWTGPAVPTAAEPVARD